MQLNSKKNRAVVSTDGTFLQGRMVEEIGGYITFAERMPDRTTLGRRTGRWWRLTECSCKGGWSRRWEEIHQSTENADNFDIQPDT